MRLVRVNSSDPDLLLELLDLMADCGRRQIELGGRAGEAQMPSRRLDGAERARSRDVSSHLRIFKGYYQIK